MRKLFSLALFTMTLHAQASYPIIAGFPATFTRYDSKPAGVYGDSYHFYGYTQSGKRLGGLNDGGVNKSCNFDLVLMTSYSSGNLAGTNMQSATGAGFCDPYPSGYGHESTVDADYGNGCPGVGQACTNKFSGAFCLAGRCYALIHHSGLQSGSSTLDADVLTTDDIDASPPHWANSHTMQLSGGSVPHNSTTANGDLINWAGGNIAFPNDASTTSLQPVLPANYQDDGVTACPTVGGQNTYLYFKGTDGTGLYIYRLLCSAIPQTWAWKANMQVWTGSAWSSTLSSKSSVATVSGGCALSGSGVGFWGVNGFGSQPAPTYLPDFNRYIIISQYYNDGCDQGQLKSHMCISQAADLLGPWTYCTGAKNVAQDQFQYGFDPRGIKLHMGGTLSAGATTLTLWSGCTTAAAASGNCSTPDAARNYYAFSDPPFPYIMQVDSEQMLVTAASNETRTVTRGYNGTTATTHADGTFIQQPYRIHPALFSFIPGTYNYNANGTATIDIIGECDESEIYSKGDYAIYTQTPCFVTITLAKENTNGLAPQGSARVRFSNSPNRFGIPRNGLVRWYDFWDHNGKTLYPVMQPIELINGFTCNPSKSSSGTSPLAWGTQGLVFDNGLGLLPRCTTTDNFPITGNNAFSITWIVKPNTATGLQVVGNVGSYGTAGEGLSTGFSITNTGDVYIGFDNGHHVRTSTGGKITGGAWNVVTITYAGGTDSLAGTIIYVNGVAACGPSPLTACTAGGGTVTPNRGTAPWIFGLYGNGSGPCSTAGQPCNYQLPFQGTYAAFAVWNRKLSAQEARNTCRELQQAYARPPRSVTLTCN